MHSQGNHHRCIVNYFVIPHATGSGDKSFRTRRDQYHMPNWLQLGFPKGCFWSRRGWYQKWSDIRHFDLGMTFTFQEEADASSKAAALKYMLMIIPFTSHGADHPYSEAYEKYILCGTAAAQVMIMVLDGIFPVPRSSMAWITSPRYASRASQIGRKKSFDRQMLILADYVPSMIAISRCRGFLFFSALP